MNAYSLPGSTRRFLPLGPITFRAAARIAVTLLLADASTSAQVSKKFEALSTQHPPGTPNGYTWSDFDNARITNDGEITFGAFLRDQDTFSKGTGLWRGSGGSYSHVVQHGDSAPVPGEPTATFQSLILPALRGPSTGKPLSFFATYAINNVNFPSIWTVANGTLANIARVGDSAPGGTIYNDLEGAFHAASNTPAIAFAGTTGNASDQSIWYFNGTAVELAARTGQSAPDFGQYFLPAPNILERRVLGGDGTLVFFSQISNAPTTSDGVTQNRALFKGKNSSYQAVVRIGENVPDIPGAIFAVFSELYTGINLGFDVNASGNVFFASTLANKSGQNVITPSNEFGLFVDKKKFVQTGDPVPNSPTGETFSGLGGGLINRGSRVAFNASTYDGNDSRGCIFVTDGTEFRRVVKTGDPAPGTEPGTLFTSVSLSQFNNKGQVAFTGTTTGGVFGLWGTDPDGNVLLVARLNDQIEVAPGDNRTIIDILPIGFAGPDDGRAKALNESGQLVFCVRLSGSRSGIVRASLGNAGGGNTSANFKESIDEGDPVNTRAGELLGSHTDLNLRGPMPLVFSRRYAALLASDDSITSALGPNWLSNFDVKLTVTDTTAQAVTNEGRVMSFAKTNGKWSLTAPLDIPFQLVQSGVDFILADPRSQRMWTFDAAGVLTKIEDGRGNTHTLTYTSGKLTSVSDGLGRTLTLTYNAEGQLVTVSDGTRTVQYAYDGNGNLSDVTDPLNHTTHFDYAAGALLTSTKLPRGNTPITQTFSNKKVMSQVEHPVTGDQTTAFAYDTAARTTTISDPNGQTRVHAYTAAGGLESFTDEAGKTITIDADAAGRRGSVTDQLGHTTSVTYHAPSGKPASITNAEGATAKFTYKPRTVHGITFYDLVKIVRADGSIRSFTYDATGNVLTATDPLGKKSTYAYNTRGQLTRKTNPTGGITTYTYDETSAVKGNLKTSKDSDTGETTYTCDAFSRLVQITRPDTTHVEIVYDLADNVLDVTNEEGKHTAFTYDANDNLTTVTDAATKQTQVMHDDLDRVSGIIDRLGKTSSRGFDSRDLIASETDKLNHTTSYAHDTRRRISGITDPGNASVTFGYDDTGRLTSITDPLGHTETIARNGIGSAVATTNALGQTLQFQRDALQRVTRLIDPLGRQNTLSYDKAGRLVTATRDGVGAARYVRDAAGRLVNLTDPNHGLWGFAYTPAGRWKSANDPLGRKTTATYDTRGRLATVTFPDASTCAITRDGTSRVTELNFSDGPVDLHYGYDSLGRLSTATDANDAGNNVAFTYDAEGRMLTSADGGLTFTSTYDDAGRLVTLNYGGLFTVTYTYDSRDRCTRVDDNIPGGGQADFTFDDAGRLLTITRANGTTTTRTFDDADRIIRVRHTSSLTDFIDLRYTLDAAGDLASLDVAAPLLPMVSASTESFTFDKASQIATAGYSYDSRGRLTASPDHTFTWDGASRLRSIDGVTLKYNSLGDISNRATTNAGHIYALPHAPIGALVSGTTTTCYIWSPGGQLLYAVDFVTGTAQPPRYYHFDRLGSTIAITNNAGAVLSKYAYGPYGELLTGSSPEDPFMYIGEFGVRTEGPFYQMRARYYDPQTARFLSRDPAPPQLKDPRTLDPYLYALGNPTRYIDPDGAEPSEPGNGKYHNPFHGPVPEFRDERDYWEAVYLDVFGTNLLFTKVEPPNLPVGEVFRNPNWIDPQRFQESLADLGYTSSDDPPADTTPIETPVAEPSAMPPKAGDPADFPKADTPEEVDPKADHLIDDGLETEGGDEEPAAAKGGRITDAFDAFVKKVNEGIQLAKDKKKFKQKVREQKYKKKLENAPYEDKAKKDKGLADENKKKAEKEYGFKERAGLTE